MSRETFIHDHETGPGLTKEDAEVLGGLAILALFPIGLFVWLLLAPPSPPAPQPAPAPVAAPAPVDYICVDTSPLWRPKSEVAPLRLRCTLSTP